MTTTALANLRALLGDIHRAYRQRVRVRDVGQSGIDEPVVKAMLAMETEIDRLTASQPPAATAPVTDDEINHAINELCEASYAFEAADIAVDVEKCPHAKLEREKERALKDLIARRIAEARGEPSAEPDEQTRIWREALPKEPIESCGRLDMATYLPEPATVGRVTSDRIRYVYFKDGSECVVLGELCDHVAFRAADYDKRALASEQPPAAQESPFRPGCPEHVSLWDAINAVVRASGGSDANKSIARQNAVVLVESAMRNLMRLGAPPAAQEAPAKRSDALRALDAESALRHKEAARFLREIRELRVENVRLEELVAAQRAELCLAYDVFEALPESALDGIEDAKLLRLMRKMDDEQKREAVRDRMDTLVKENERLRKLQPAAQEASFRSYHNEALAYVRACIADKRECDLHYVVQLLCKEPAAQEAPAVDVARQLAARVRVAYTEYRNVNPDLANELAEAVLRENRQ